MWMAASISRCRECELAELASASPGEAVRDRVTQPVVHRAGFGKDDLRGRGIERAHLAEKRPCGFVEVALRAQT
jgi:hypothetical protein